MPYPKLIFRLVVGGMMLMVIGLLLADPPPSLQAAQSTRDTIATRTPTPTSLPTVKPTPTWPVLSSPAPKVWLGRLASNTLGVTEGNGSIFRVTVAGLAGIPIELRAGEQVITALSGSKPEYGPYFAEFAPLPAGVWQVSVPSLGVSLPVVADSYNLAVIEFSQVSAPVASQTAQPVAPAPPLEPVWEARLVSETAGSGVPFSRLLVRVIGRNDQPVRLSTPLEVINTAATGQKPAELGPYMVEFTGLTPAKYIIEPLGLNIRFEVELKANVVSQVEFQPLPPTATATPWPTPTLPFPSPTFTPPPAATLAPAATPTATPTATPPPLPTAVTRWLGTIVSREPADPGPAAIEVRLAEISGAGIRLLREGDGSGLEKRCVTGQGEAEKDRCRFDEVSPGHYIVSPEGLGLSLPLAVSPNEMVRVAFELMVLPPGITGWQSRVDRNSNGSQAVSQAAGVITIWLEQGRLGQLVALRSARGTEKLCEASRNPFSEALFCEFAGLRPGVYLIELLHTGANHRLFVDGQGQVQLTFSPEARQVAEPQRVATPIVGGGAQPRLTRPSPTPPPATAITLTLPPTLAPTATATAEPRPSLIPTPTPAFAWQGRIVERVDKVAGTIGVRAAGLDQHPVILRSGSWQSQPQLTGNKPELGLYATEFGGLAQGEYIVELVGLAELKVFLAGDQFLLIEFRYDFVNPPN
jgi:hypothetical protein